MAEVLRRDIPMAIGGWFVAVALLLWLHGHFMPGWALICALLGGVGLRRFLSVTYGTLPPFLALPIEAGVGVFGISLAVLATFGAYELPYWVLRWGQAVSVVVGVSVLGLGLATVIYTHSRLAREIEAQEARLSKLRGLAQEAQFKALQAQVNPHFLFNALNTLAELVHEDADQAEELIGDLAHMMRYALRSSSGTVRLAQEIKMVQRYLRLERARLGDRLRVDLEVENGTDTVDMPGLILQPLVENAILHAVASRTEGGQIRIRVSEGSDAVHIEVSDDGPGLPLAVKQRVESEQGEDAGQGTGGAGGGLANVVRRLFLAYGTSRPTLTIDTPEEGGTRLRLEVPRQ